MEASGSASFIQGSIRDLSPSDYQTHLPHPPLDCSEVEYVLTLDEDGRPRWVTRDEEGDLGLGCAAAFVGSLAVVCAMIVILVNGW